MAEILISLTIIGIVAAITLPTLTGNINKKTWETQKKALYARMSQAISLLPSLNGYGIGATSSITNEIAAETFVTEGLAKVLKINNICTYTNYQDCGFPEKFKNINGGKVNMSEMLSLNGLSETFSKNYEVYLNTKIAAFETANGESLVVYYYPLCRREGFLSPYGAQYYPEAKMCVNFIYDLNGKKGPNKVGEDMGFITAIRPIDPLVFTGIPLQSYIVYSKGNKSEMNHVCNTLKSGVPARALNLEEMSAMIYNKKVHGFFAGNGIYFTTTEYGNDYMWAYGSYRFMPHLKTSSFPPACMKK